MQFNWLRSRAIFLILSSVGLASCAPDQPGKDSFKISAPTFHLKNDKEATWAEVSAKDTTPFDQNDQIQFAKDGEYSLTVVASCSVRQMEVKQVSQWTNPDRISLVQLLPRAVLLAPTADSTPCSLHFTAKNRHGSVHLFQLTRIAVQVNTTGTLKVKKDGVYLTGTSVENVKLGDWSRYMIDIANSNGQIGLECERHQIPGPKNSNSAGFTSFNPLLAKSYNGELPLSAYSVQYCRVIQTVNSQRMDVSPLLRVEFPPSDLKVKVQFQNKITDGAVLVRLNIKNENQFKMSLAFPSLQKRTVQARFFNHGKYYDKVLGYDFLNSEDEPTPLVHTLEPDEEAEFYLKIVPRFKCIDKIQDNPALIGTGPNIWLNFHQGVSVSEVSDGQHGVEISILTSGTQVLYNLKGQLQEKGGVPYEDAGKLKRLDCF